ncbi:MAG: tetratricopeptide repeat protein [Candidatus Aminicenantes bacterium]|nr:tetratricopeptide repeat protein [Candidatus Aminicenantes bacterium]
MTEESFKRKLTAILSADVEGYSRLMGEDEDATIRTLTSYRELMITLILKHRGRVVDSPGDNVLAEFASVVDAVEFAVAIQKEFKVKNTELPENRRMHFRIGINLGDVVEEGERIYGDGVNIAARIEGLAEGGGICISRTAFDQVKNKLSLGYEYLGEHAVKNIAEPVRVYKVLTEPEAVGKVIGEERPKPKHWRWAALAALVALIVATGALAIWNFYFRPPPMEPASVEKMAYPLRDKPSIAVLPFVNMSEDPNQEYFSDGITENIITALSKVEKLFVIARNSSFTYKGKPVKVQQVAQDLGVQYVLEGSIQKSADRIRITAQLIDARKGHHLWAERYDRDLKDLFALQDEITVKVITALQVKLTEGEQARIYGRGTKNLEAYFKVLEGREQSNRFNKDGNALGRQMFEQAIALDPNYAMAYWRLSATHLMDLILGSTKSPKRSLKQAEELVQKALALDGALAEAHALLGRIYLAKRQYEQAIAEGERAIAIDPNSPIAQYALAFSLTRVGKYEEAIALYKKAMRSDPIPSPSLLTMLGNAYILAGRYEDGISTLKKVLRRSPDNLVAHVGLAIGYSSSGRDEEARNEAIEILRIDPEFSLEHFGKRLMYKSQADTDRVVGALRKAGLK